jgi:hypothetical protein
VVEAGNIGDAGSRSLKLKALPTFDEKKKQVDSYFCSVWVLKQ